MFLSRERTVGGVGEGAVEGVVGGVVEGVVEGVVGGGGSSRLDGSSVSE